MSARSGEAIQAPTASAMGAFLITKSDATTFATMTKAVYVGGTGDVAVRMANGDDVTFKSVPAGALLPIQVQMVKLTGTSATDMLGLI